MKMILMLLSAGIALSGCAGQTRLDREPVRTGPGEYVADQRLAAASTEVTIRVPVGGLPVSFAGLVVGTAAAAELPKKHAQESPVLPHAEAAKPGADTRAAAGGEARKETSGDVHGDVAAGSLKSGKKESPDRTLLEYTRR